MVTGSPAFTCLGSASASSVNCPIAPVNEAGAPGGSGLTSRTTGSLVSSTFRWRPKPPKGSLKNGSLNGLPVDERGRARGRTTRVSVTVGPTVNGPVFSGVIEVLKMIAW